MVSIKLDSGRILKFYLSYNPTGSGSRFKTSIQPDPDNVFKLGSDRIRVQKSISGSGKSLTRNAPASQRQKFFGSGPTKTLLTTNIEPCLASLSYTFG